MEILTLTIPAAPRLLKVIRCMIAEICQLAGFSLKERDKVCLAVDEACSNIIRHSYKGNPEGQVQITCRLEADKITVSIRDFGEKIDLARVRQPDPDTVKPGGLGVHMIRSIMDEVEYDCSHEVGTEIHMTKYIQPREKQDGS